MNVKSTLILLLLAVSCVGYSQQYITRTGHINFYSKTPLEDIKASNKQVLAIVDIDKKVLAFTLLMKGFEFKKELMQTHFNENYVESDRYPKASFAGTYTTNENLEKGSQIKVQVKGNLTLHGVTRMITMPATLQLKNGKLIGNASFKANPADFNITIPSLVRDKIAKEVDVEVNIECDAKN